MVPGKLITKQKLGKGIPDGSALKGGRTMFKSQKTFQ